MLSQLKRNAFRNCTNLTEVNIPASANEIQMYAFYNSGLTNAEFELTDGWRIGEEELTYRYLEIEEVTDNDTLIVTQRHKCSDTYKYK